MLRKISDFDTRPLPIFKKCVIRNVFHIMTFKLNLFKLIYIFKSFIGRAVEFCRFRSYYIQLVIITNLIIFPKICIVRDKNFEIDVFARRFFSRGEFLMCSVLLKGLWIFLQDFSVHGFWTCGECSLWTTYK